MTFFVIVLYVCLDINNTYMYASFKFSSCLKIYARMGRLTSVQRYEALALIRIGTSHREVVRRLNYHHSTIDRFDDHAVSQNELCAGSAQIWASYGYPRQDQHVTLTHVLNRFFIAASTVGRIQHTHQITVSTSTIRRRLRVAHMTS